ncbi:class I SAM-dependent methyltransferase [Nocardia sp. NPDC050712]|uniref:class I SAM-dependent methyltransferase n=1 Tax=Nocardia sp. NPDC050712 TaxID=3155518 RepID=UPI0033D4D0EC
MTHDSEHAMLELLELDGEVLGAHLSRVLTELARLLPAPPQRILDLGAGTGVGTLALLEHFDKAEVIAVDRSPRMLDVLRAKADSAGVADRVRIVTADLARPWPDFGPVDLIWTDSFLHHLPDATIALRQAFGALTTGGLLAAAEKDSYPIPRFLGESALEDRLAALMRSDHPPVRPALTEAGFRIVADRRYDIALAGPATPVLRRYAQLCLSRMLHFGRDGLTPADREALTTLTAPTGADSVLHRADLTVRTTRTLLVAG